MSNIEQQWANVDLANSLSTSPYTTQNEQQNDEENPPRLYPLG